jgi:UDP-N-acetylglucosamine--N-acetylmuramyl-(pentapeptide) pyrophosphoryl-undecaprenol N-acetylglucosamine transferase
MPQSQKTSLKMPKTPVIVLTGGGSGGHITPLLSLARELKVKSPHCNIIYIGHKGDKFDSLQEGFHDFDFVAFVNGGKFRRYYGESFTSHMLDFRTIVLNIRDFFRVLGSIGKAWRILARVKPEVVFSKGGFVGVPVGIAAKIRGIPIVTHDSDTVPGLANKIVGRWAIVHATGMPPQFYDYPKDKMIYTGIPIDERIVPISEHEQQKFKKAIGINPESQVLLVVGGSLGSRDINEKVLKIADELLSTYQDLHIVHIAGTQNEDGVKASYAENLNNKVKKQITVLGFTPELYRYTLAADLVICRAGATQVAEFAAAHKACVLIPSPFLTGGHQIKNAEQLQKIGAVEVLENDAPADELLGKIVKLLASPKQRKILEEKLGKTAKLSASSELAEILLKTANKK